MLLCKMTHQNCRHIGRASPVLRRRHSASRSLPSMESPIQYSNIGGVSVTSLRGEAVNSQAKGKKPPKRPASRAEISYPRKRAVQACRTCRVRRTKCDNERPACTSCQTLGSDCIYTQKDHST